MNTTISHDKMKLGEYFKQERERRGMSLGELSRQAKVSKGHLHDIENGKYNPRLLLAARIAMALDIHLDDLLKEAE